MREHDIKADPSTPESVLDAEHNEDAQALEKLQVETTRLAEELEPYFPLVPVLSEAERSISMRHLLPIALQDIDIENPEPQPPPLRDIAETVAEHFNIEYPYLISSSQKQDVILPRHLAVYLMYNMTPSSYPTVAKAMGRVDHTSAVYAVRKIEKLISEKPDIHDDIQQIKQTILHKQNTLVAQEHVVVIAREGLTVCQLETLDRQAKRLFGTEKEFCLNWDTRSDDIAVWQQHGYNALSALKGLLARINQTGDLYDGYFEEI